MAPHSRIRVWRIPWTEKPGRLIAKKSDTLSPALTSHLSSSSLFSLSKWYFHINTFEVMGQHCFLISASGGNYASFVVVVNTWPRISWLTVSALARAKCPSKAGCSSALHWSLFMLSLAAVSGGYSLVVVPWLLSLWSTGSRAWA